MSVQHVFERAGLGLAPFRFTHIEHRTYQAGVGAPVQPGGSCDFCGTGICYFCWIESADGKRFKVGTDCVEKTGDKGLRKAMDRARKEAELVRHAEKVIQGAAFLAEHRDVLAALPHPNGFGGRSLLSYLEWMLKHAGHSGQLRALRIARKAVSQ